MTSAWAQAQHACTAGDLPALTELIAKHNLIDVRRIREYSAKYLLDNTLRGPADISRHLALLEIAARRGYAEIVRYLLNMHGTFGMAMFVASMSSKSAETMQAFLDVGPNVMQALGAHDITCLAEALFFPPDTALIAVQVLLQNGYDPYYHLPAPLLRAVYLSSPAVVDELERHGAGPPKGGLLFAAAASGSLEMAGYLLDAGADINCATPHTALYSATYDGMVDMVRFLLQRGADRTMASFEGGPTALAVAEEMGHHDIVALLRA